MSRSRGEEGGGGGVPGAVLRTPRFARALGVIGLGYALLAVPPADGIASLTVAPVLLVVGYCVLVPMAILAPGRGAKVTDGTASH